MQETKGTQVKILGKEDPLQEEMAGEKWQLTPVFLSGKFYGQRSLHSNGVTKNHI